MTSRLFWPNCDVLLFAVTPLTNAEPLAVSLRTFWICVRFWFALTDVVYDGIGNSEYDGLLMPRPFRVRYSVEQPDQHEILDPLLREMMKRTLHRIGTRPAVAKPLTASAEEVLAHIDRWDERLRYLRRRRYLSAETSQKSSDWKNSRKSKPS